MLGDALADKAGLCGLWMPSPFLVRIVAHRKMLKQLITGGGPQKAEESENMDCDSKLHLENHSRKPSRDRFFHCPIKQALWPNTSSLAPILHLLRGWGYFHQVSDEPGHCEKQQPGRNSYRGSEKQHLLVSQGDLATALWVESGEGAIGIANLPVQPVSLKSSFRTLGVQKFECDSILFWEYPSYLSSLYPSPHFSLSLAFSLPNFILSQRLPK